MAKNNWVAWIAIIALVLAVVVLVFVLNGSVTGNAILPSNLTIKANSCDKDNVCEVKSIKNALNRVLDINSNSGFDITSNNKTEISGYPLMFKGDEVYFKIGTKGVTFENSGNILLGTEGYMKNITIFLDDVISNKLIIRELANKNSPNGYYLCIDNTNAVYKSTLPCR